MLWTMAAFVGGGLSLIGIPLTAGFISKWYLILAAMERGWWPVVAIVLISSLIAVIYIWRVVEAVYLSLRPDSAEPVSEAPMSLMPLPCVRQWKTFRRNWARSPPSCTALD